MSRPANVTSTDAVQALQRALQAFESDAHDAVTLLTLEVRRAQNWIEVDRIRYWPEQVRRASDRLIEARSELERCQLKYGSEDPPSCYEQKKRFEKARQRLRYCEEKVRLTKQWLIKVRQAVSEFEGQLAKLTNALETDVPRAVATLDRMLRALDRYAGTTAPPREASSPKPETEEGGHETL